MKFFLSSLRKLDSSAALRDRTASRRQSQILTTLLLSGTITGSLIGLMARGATAAPLNNTDIYVNYSTSNTAINQIRTISPSGVLSPLLFQTGVANTAALGLDPVSLQLYYSDRTLNPNNLMRYNGTTESGSLGTFAGTSATPDPGIPMVRMGFRGSVGYGVSNDNTMYTFTTGSPNSTISSLGLMTFQGTSPSGATSSGDIAFDGNGFGWAIFGNSLYRINLNGGVREAIPIGQITIGGIPLPVANTANNNTGVTVGSIAFDAAGDLYIAGLDVVANALQGTTIYKVDINDATAVKVGSTFTGGFITDMASGSQPTIAPVVTATKSVSPTGLARPGDTLTYTIEVENTGTAPAVNLDFTDVLPAGTTYVPSSTTLNGVAIASVTYPYATATRINGRTSSAGALKVGYSNRATITFQVTINTTNVPTSVTNQGTIVYLDGPSTNTTPATTTISTANGYKSAKLTIDADGSGTITPGDTVTWTISYKNFSAVPANNFQINDQLPSGVTVASTGAQTVVVSGVGTSATKNITYTGVNTGSTSDLLDAGSILAPGGVATVSIPTVVNSGFTGALNNQSNATGSSITGTGSLSDNVDSTSAVPAGITVPAGSVVQTQTTNIDPTSVNVVAAKDFGDAPSSYGSTSHSIVSGTHLGVTVTAEGTNYNSAQANGDTGDDGITLNGAASGTYILNASTESATNNTIAINPTTNGFASLWIDYNQDGDFNDVGEQVLNNDAVTSGTQNRTVSVPNSAVPGYTFARVRYSTTSGTANTPTGAASNGEVEDYVFKVQKTTAPLACSASSSTIYTSLDFRHFERVDNATHWARRAGTLPNGKLVDVRFTRSGSSLGTSDTWDRISNIPQTAPADALTQVANTGNVNRNFQIDVFEAGTSIPVVGNYIFNFVDIDGHNQTGARNSSMPTTTYTNNFENQHFYDIAGYTISSDTRLYLDPTSNSPTDLFIQSAASNNSDGTLNTRQIAIRVAWENKSTMNFTYFTGQFGGIDIDGQGYNTSGIIANCSVPVSISGTVFEDPNYGGGAGRPLSTASTSPRNGATVELYKSDGTYVSNTITASGGKYTFANLAAGDYKVRVVNSTVSSSRLNPTSATGLVAVQTFRTDAGLTAGTVTAVADHVGGEKPAEIDAPANTTATLATLNAVANQEVQSLTTVKVGSSDVSGIDFGYNFDTIVNTNDAGQGSLRQFVTNSNALTNTGLAQQGLTASKETSIFMISSGTATPGIQASVPRQLTDGVAVINIATELPPITDANTIIDGTTQTTNVGNNNTLQFGTGGTVGVGNTPLAKVNKPEVELSDGGLGLAKGLEILANDTTVRGISIWGFGKDTSQSEFHNQITIGNWSPISPARTLIEQNIIGTKASDFSVTGAPGRGSTAGSLNSGSGIYLLASTNTTIQNNLIGFNAGNGILSFGNNDQLLVSGNELRSNGTESTRDGVGLENGTKNSQAINNLIIDNAANGVSIYKNGINSQLLVENNTIQNSGRNYSEEAGVAAFDTAGGNDKISKNIITGSRGAGIWLEKTVSTMTITKNSIYNNGGLGIDLKGATLDTGSGNQTTVLNTVTPNDGSNTVANIANKGTDYPIITSSKLNVNGDLTVIGYVGTGIVTTSPFAGATLEFFVANNTPANQDGQVISGDGKSKSHGEGQTYIGGNTIGNICTVATNGSFTCTFPSVGSIVTDPKNITATTTDPLGNTSEFSSIPSNKADVLFVKRITAIKDIETGTNTSYNTFVDDITSSTKINDNNCGWPGATPIGGVCITNTYTLGATSETALKVKPGDEIEYTIYYLNAGENKAKQARICDQLDNNLTFKDDTLTTPPTTAPLNIQFVPGGGSVQPLTNLTGDDSGELTTPILAGSTCNLDANTGTNLSNNVVVVDVGTETIPVMGSTGVGIPTTSYGYIRFKTTVK